MSEVAKFREWFKTVPEDDHGFKSYMGMRVVESDALMGWMARAAMVPGWNFGTPPVGDNDTRQYIIAVRRAGAPERVFVFQATFANNYSSDDLYDTDGNFFIANGWYTLSSDSSGEFDTFYEPVLDAEGDEVLGWQQLPKWGSE